MSGAGRCNTEIVAGVLLPLGRISSQRSLFHILLPILIVRVLPLSQLHPSVCNLKPFLLILSVRGWAFL